jgi:hypothetical protein
VTQRGGIKTGFAAVKELCMRSNIHPEPLKLIDLIGNNMEKSTAGCRALNHVYSNRKELIDE